MGVWIDVVKLCPGDEIRPMVRTMVNRVLRCVVFLSPAYIASPNCCVELHEAVQWPDKLVICILEPVPAMEQFLRELEDNGAIIVHGLRELIYELDAQICDVNDSAAFKWWRRQKISATSGVPDNVVPTHWRTIPKFRLMGKLAVPPRSLTVGPVYLAGDCSETGFRFLPPYLFLLALVAVVANAADIAYTYFEGSGDCNDDPMSCHSTIDWIWSIKQTNERASPAHCEATTEATSHSFPPLSLLLLLRLGIMAVCNLAPFTAWSSLFETRSDVHPVLRPLLASKSINGGIKITVVGHDNDPIVQSLNQFLTQIGHNSKAPPVPLTRWGTQRSVADEGAVTAAASPAVAIGLESVRASVIRRRRESLAAGFSQSIVVYVMRDFVQRDALFGSEQLPFDQRSSLFVWSDPTSDPFTKDEIGPKQIDTASASSTAARALGQSCFSAVFLLALPFFLTVFLFFAALLSLCACLFCVFVQASV